MRKLRPLDQGKVRGGLEPDAQAAYDLLAEQRLIGDASADQATRIKAWWTPIMETITTAGSLDKALGLVEPEDYLEDLLWVLVDLDWARFPVAMRRDGRPLMRSEMSRAAGVVTYRVFRDRLSRWAQDVALATANKKPQQPQSAGSHFRPLSEAAKSSAVRGHDGLQQIRDLGDALNSLPDQVVIRAQAPKATQPRKGTPGPAAMYLVNLTVKSGSGIEKRSLGKFADLKGARAACATEIRRHLTARQLQVEWRQHTDSTGLGIGLPPRRDRRPRLRVRDLAD